jgi:multidrug efflux pump
MFIALKPLGDRPGRVSADQVVNRLRRKLTSVPGATLFLVPNQDIQIGGRGSDAQYQYTLSVNLVIDRDTASRLGITAAAIDQVLYDAFGQREVSTMYTGLNQYFVVMEVDPKYQRSPDSLNGIFIKANNVVGATTSLPATVAPATTALTLAAAPQATPAPSTPLTLSEVAVHGSTSTAATTTLPYTTPVASPISAPASNAITGAVTSPAGAVAASTATSGLVAPTPSSGGAMVPLSAIAHYADQRTSLQVNHQGQYPAITLTFNLAPNVALGDAVTAIESTQRELAMPSAIHATFQGTAQAFQDSLRNEPYLILAALVAVYIVLGILYESLIHPLTILSTLPPAGVGAILALLLTGTELSIIALIGIILLIGIVKKNAIMMIDFALQAERDQGLPPIDAIFQACMLRFRPIMMTTMAALFGGMPLAIGMGVGSELRKPLGITIVGGLLVSQALTLFTTPVVYLFFDRLQWKIMKLHKVGVELEEAPGD